MNKITKGATVALDALVAECEQAFKSVRPDWSPPPKTIFAVGKRHGLTLMVNGKTSAEWSKNVDKLFENGDLPDSYRVTISGRPEIVMFRWLDIREISGKIAGGSGKSPGKSLPARKKTAKLPPGFEGIREQIAQLAGRK